MVAVIYSVNVAREGDSWLADVADLPGAHTWAKNLTSLKASVIEVIRLVEDTSDNAADPEIRLRFSGVTPAFAAAAEIGERRRELDGAVQDLVAASVRAAREMAAEGWSVRDISGVLHVTPGRVSQMLAQKTVKAA